MLCPTCHSPAPKFGRNRNGSQRHACGHCDHTFTDPATIKPDGRRLDPEQLVACLRMILEGNSIRATARLTGVKKDTIMQAIVENGQRCERFLERTIRDYPAVDVQADEIWGFVKMKDRTRQCQGIADGADVGDCWCFVAFERATKLILTFHVDKRTSDATEAFGRKLRAATHGRFQLSTDGFRPYGPALWRVFRSSIDHAQLIKVYGREPNERGSRYSPPVVIDTFAIRGMGEPDMDRVCTSHVERQNLNIRMQIRRMTRLTNAHSKKWANHQAALALYFAYYNWCRVHMTLKTTPAVESGLTDHVWKLDELLDNLTTSH